MRLYQEDAESVIGDPTELERYKAPKTPFFRLLSLQLGNSYRIILQGAGVGVGVDLTSEAASLRSIMGIALPLLITHLLF